MSKVVCSVPRGGGLYDYFLVPSLPQRRMGTPGMAPLADALPMLPAEATPNGSGAIARGVICSRGGLSPFFYSVFGANFWAQVFSGLVLYFILTGGKRVD